MPTIKRITAGQASVPASFARPVAGNLGEKISSLGDVMVQAAKHKKNIEDTIEANKLLAEHAIRSSELQSDVLRSDMPEDKIVDTYKKNLEELDQQILDQAQSEDVRQALESHLPSRNAGKVIEMQQESNKRFWAKSAAKFYESLQLNEHAYAVAKTDDERKTIRGRNTAAIDLFASQGGMTADQAEKEKIALQHKFDLADIEREMNSGDATSMANAILHPEEFAKKYPGVTVDDLDKIISQGVKQAEWMRKTVDRRRKEVREQKAIALDTLAIRGKLSFNDIVANQQYISDDENRRLLDMVNKQYEAGGIDDPGFKGHLSTEIRLNPWAVSPGDILAGMESGRLSRDGGNELLDLREKWIKAFKEDAEKTDPRLKGPLYQEGKSKIDQIIGKGITIHGIALDNDTARRWASATDEYLSRIQREPERSQVDIANEIIDRYQGPAKPGEITPYQYRGKNDKILWNKLANDAKNAKTPEERKKYEILMKRLRQSRLMSDPENY